MDMTSIFNYKVSSKVMLKRGRFYIPAPGSKLGVCIMVYYSTIAVYNIALNHTTAC